MATHLDHTFTRRAALKGLGALSCVTLAGGALTELPSATASPPGSRLPRASSDFRGIIAKRVFETQMVDTHEHLIEETERFKIDPRQHVTCDDWALLFSQYLNSDFLSAGMSKTDMNQFLSPKVDPAAKWKLIEPYWPAVKHTGYAEAVRVTLKELYGVDELSATTVRAVQAGYEKTRKPGFYQRILRDMAGLESCQVNCLSQPFLRSAQPLLLTQDLNITGMFAGLNIRTYAGPANIQVKDLGDWHRAIDWWFDRYAKYAVAVKSLNAYSRDIDYARVPAEKAAPVFLRVLEKEPVAADDQKLLEDHLFWYAVDKATSNDLPVKIHTGYYSGENRMPLARLQRNPGSASDLCRLSPQTRFVFMHIGYPHYEELLALVKHFNNAFVDMCWTWIVNPVAAKDYFKKHIVTAPANKLLPFGGDYFYVELVLGHSILARRAISQALAELVYEGSLTLKDALELVNIILRDNARRLFRLEMKYQALRSPDWTK